MKLRFIFLLFLTCYFAACTPIKVQQGNLLPQSRIERLQIGMSKEEVSKIMGTSLLITPFSEQHWDYAYTIRVGNGPTTKKRLELDFEGNKLTKICHNEQP